MNTIKNYELIKEELVEAIYNTLNSIYDLKHDSAIRLSEFIFNTIPNTTLMRYLPLIINYELDDPFINKTISDANIFYRDNYKLFQGNKKKILIPYAQIGLIKSIENFNGKSNFYNYSKIYIRSEMLKCISDHRFNILPHKIKSSSKIPRYIKEKYDVAIIGSNNEWQFDKYNINGYKYNYDHLNKLSNVNLIVDNLEPKMKRTFKYRYDYNLKSIRSIEDVSELMCWSTETTRKTLLQAYDEIRQKINSDNKI